MARFLRIGRAVVRRVRRRGRVGSLRLTVPVSRRRGRKRGMYGAASVRLSRPAMRRLIRRARRP